MAVERSVGKGKRDRIMSDQHANTDVMHFFNSDVGFCRQTKVLWLCIDDDQHLSTHLHVTQTHHSRVMSRNKTSCHSIFKSQLFIFTLSNHKIKMFVYQNTFTVRT